MSSGFPGRCRGIVLAVWLTTSLLIPNACTPGVSIKPGHTAFTLIFKGASSSASARVKPARSSLDGRFALKSISVPEAGCEPFPDGVFANGFESP